MLTAAVTLLSSQNCSGSDESPTPNSAASTSGDGAPDQQASGGTDGAPTGGGAGVDGGGGTGGGDCRKAGGEGGCPAGGDPLACSQDPTPRPATPPAGAPHHAWSKALEAGGSLIVADVAGAPNGDIAVTGDFVGTTDFGSGSVEAPPSGRAFVARFDASGAPLWSRVFAGSQPLCDVDVAGNVYVAGGFAGDDIDLGGGTISYEGPGIDFFFAKYDPAGTHVWSGAVRGNQAPTIEDLAVDALGRLVLAGMFSETLDLGSGLVLSASAVDEFDQDGFLIVLDPSGSVAWAKSLESEPPANVNGGSDLVTAVEIDSSGNPVVSVNVYRPASFSAGPASLPSVLVGYDAVGGVRWVRGSPFGSDLGSMGPIVVADGALLVGAKFKTGLAKIDDAGQVSWTLEPESGESGAWSWVVAAAATPAGGALFAGRFAGALSLGGRTVTSAGLSDVFLAGVDASGAVEWLHRYGGTGNESVVSMARSPDGSLVLAGRFSCSADFGGGALATNTPCAHLCFEHQEYGWFGNSYLLGMSP